MTNNLIKLSSDFIVQNIINIKTHHSTYYKSITLESIDFIINHDIDKLFANIHMEDLNKDYMNNLSEVIGINNELSNPLIIPLIIPEELVEGGYTKKKRDTKKKKSSKKKKKCSKKKKKRSKKK